MILLDQFKQKLEFFATHIILIRLLVSVQKKDDLIVNIPVINDPDIGFEYVASSKADAYEEFAVASGDIRESDSIKVEHTLASKLTLGPTKKSPAHLDIQSPFVGRYHTDDLPDDSICYPDGRGTLKIPQAVQAHLTLMQDCVPKWRDIDSMRRQVEAIAVSTRSTFGF